MFKLTSRTPPKVNPMDFAWPCCVSGGSSTLVSDMDNGRHYVCVGADGIWEISIPSSDFVVNVKLLKKNPKIFTKEEQMGDMISNGYKSKIIIITII